MRKAKPDKLFSGELNRVAQPTFSDHAHYRLDGSKLGFRNQVCINPLAALTGQDLPVTSTSESQVLPRVGHPDEIEAKHVFGD